jgi:hypothetical protein
MIHPFHLNLCISLSLISGILLAQAFTDRAQASCGAAFCTINTSWNLQGAAVEPGWRIDLRAEYVKQDQLRAGNDDVAAGQFARHHDEVKSRNRNLLATLDYAVNNQFGIAATLPVVDRDHLHIHNHRGARIPESWDFTRAGDLRVQGRYQWSMDRQKDAGLEHFGLNMGLKLPTGQTHVDNAGGDRAERSLQPGTGTTDLILGAFYNRLLASQTSSWFVQGLLQQPLNRHENYEPGQRISADLGYRYEVSSRIGLLAQLNALFVERDRGAEAEPEDTGGKFVHLSPGATFAVTPGAQLYGFVQLPLYQYVNGVQLTSDWSATAGVSIRF